jgi:hypothetical protein
VVWPEFALFEGLGCLSFTVRGWTEQFHAAPGHLSAGDVWFARQELIACGEHVRG